MISQTIGYFCSDVIRLDSQNKPDLTESVPDKVVSAGVGAKKASGPSVSVRDVLDKKTGDEVWVVIKGEVYK